MPYIVYEAGQSWLVRGIPSRESIEPSDPIERVRTLPSESLRALYGTCLRTTSRPSPNGKRTFTRTTRKQLTEASMTRGPGKGSMACFTPPPCGKADRGS